MKNRREFLTQLGVAGSAVALLPSTGCARKKKPTDKVGGQRQPGTATPTLTKKGRAKVVLVTSPRAVGPGNKPDRKVVRAMLEKGLTTLAGTSDASAALKQWVSPRDIVGLKVNCLGGRHMSTRVELTEQLVVLLAEAGLPRNRAVVFDRSDFDLRNGGYPVRSSGDDYLCQGNNTTGYEKNLEVMPNGASRFCNLATRRTTVLINMPVLKDHGLAGVTGAMKNNYGLVHNPNKFHLNGCDPHVAEINARPFLRKKQKLIVCDALRVQVEGGPAYHPAHAVTYGGVMLATDPVALDMMAWGLLEQLRKKQKLPSLPDAKRKPKYLFTAANQGLGVGDLKRIDLVEVKV